MHWDDGEKMNIYSFLQIAGGIGLFLYGMKLLGSSLEHLAGASLERTLAKLTNNRFKGLLLGTLVTGVIQSSSATNIMLVGFVNAGIMKLAQAIPVILGASVGTTVTGQILRLGDISASDSFLSLLKPSSFAPLIICIGAFLLLLTQNKRTKDVASLLLGFGILFFGMTTMENAFAPLEESEAFQSLFTYVSNPLIGIALGVLVCVILQSSSASIGILQAVSAAVGISFAMAAPVIIGINVGKAFPVILASLGTKKDAKRVAFCELLASVLSGILCLLVVYVGFKVFNVVDFNTSMTRGNIADFHTIYNILGSLLLLPFTTLLDKLVRFIIRGDQGSKIDEELHLLDDIFLKTPSVALEQCQQVINSMGEAVLENFRIAVELHHSYDPKKLGIIDENEIFLDKSETYLSDYLVKITARDLRPEETKLATEIMHSVMDFERIGDHCVKISEVATYNVNEKITFSSSAKAQLDTIYNAVSEILDITTGAFFRDDTVSATHVEPLEEVVDDLRDEIKSAHITRLQSGNCTVQSGISLVELLTSLERISDYCSNIALHVLARHSDADTFDNHAYVQELHSSSAEYQQLFDSYTAKYALPGEISEYSAES